MKNVTKQLIGFLLSVLLIVTMSFSAFAADAVESFTVSAEADKASANAGDIVKVSVVLSKGAPVSTFNITLNYDTACFEYQGDAAFAELCKKDCTGSIGDKVSGEIKFSAVTEGSFKEGGTMLTASFKVLKVNSEFSLTLNSIGQDNFDTTNITKYGTSSGIKISCAHGNTKTEVKKEATCTNLGQEVTVCEACGATIKTDSIPAKGHSFGDWKVTTEATCQKEGVETRTCTVCNVSETRTLPKTAHKYEWKYDEECHWQECSVCGVVTKSEEHIKSETIVDVAPTEDKEGKGHTECKICGERLSEEVIPKVVEESKPTGETQPNGETKPAPETKPTSVVINNPEGKGVVNTGTPRTVFTFFAVIAVAAAGVFVVLNYRRGKAAK